MKWGWVFDYFNKIQAGDRKEYFPSKDKIEPFVKKRTTEWLQSRKSKSTRTSPPPSYESAVRSRSRPRQVKFDFAEYMRPGGKLEELLNKSYTSHKPVNTYGYSPRGSGTGTA
jgi:hypothetical protein